MVASVRMSAARMLTTFVVGVAGIALSSARVAGADPPPSPGEVAAANGNPSVKTTSGVDDLLNLDVDQLVKVRVQPANETAPANVLNAATADFNEASTTGELLRDLPGVSTRRTSALNLDPRVRGYHSGQLNASASGMTELKTRVDIDSAFSQIDPGIVDRITVIDGPYTPFYGPGFAFLIADLVRPPRYPCGPEAHSLTHFDYGSNGRTLYVRESVLGGGRDWGAYVSYGLRVGSDYHPGGADRDSLVPAGYQKWDGLFSMSYDLDPASRIEFQLLRTEMNDVELPGVVYDLNNSRNNQFNLRYVVQQDPASPEQFVLQSWLHQTGYYGDSSRRSKQQSLYTQFFTLPSYDDFPINTLGRGQSESNGVRSYFTLGEADCPQWTLGADWRRNTQAYSERSLDAARNITFDGNVFGIPRSQANDVGVFTNLLLPLTDALNVSFGGRLDYCTASLDRNDPVVTQFADPENYYYSPGFKEPRKTLGMVYATGKLDLGGGYALNAGTGYAMRMPDLAELYSDEPYVPLVRFGNSYVSGLSTLDPERNWQVDLGLTYTAPRLSCGARGFHAAIWDYVLPVPAFIDPSAPDFIAAPKTLGRDFRYFPPQWRTDLGTLNENADTNQAGYQYVNLDRVTLLGGDLFAEVKLLDWLSVYGDIAYVRGTNRAPVVFVSNDAWYSPDGQIVRVEGTEGLPGIYPLSGTISLRVLEPRQDRWGIEFSARMVARQTHVAATLAELPTAGFAVFDLGGFYRLNDRIRLTMAVNNLLDRDYTEHGSLVMVNRAGIPTFVKEPGASALLGIEGKF